MSDETVGQSGRHRWRFFRAGGFDQVRLDTAADLEALDQLDQKLWLALSCPTRGIEFDTATLDLVDTDKDGRIRAPEIIAATQWACAMLKDPQELIRGGTALALASIDDTTDEGKQLLASARQILLNLGKGAETGEGGGATIITIEDTTDTSRIFSQTKFNGDGIVPVDSAEDAAVGGVIGEIILCLGSEVDRSGKPGVTQAKVDQFFADAKEYAEWWEKAESEKAVILPLGDATVDAVGAWEAVKGKVEDFFVRCRLAAFDGRAAGALNRQEADYTALAGQELSAGSAAIAGFPLARVEAGRALPLVEGVNPAWLEAMGKFKTLVVGPLLGERKEISEVEWKAIGERLAWYITWRMGEKGANVDKLGLARVKEILAGGKTGGYKAAIDALIAQDNQLAPEANAIAAVDRLVRYHRDLYKLLVNYVNFRDFYGRKDLAVFQAGRLYLDQRSCDLCVQVADMTRHGLMAHLSYAYLAYCEVVRKATNEKMTIVAAFTNGDSDNLMVGRNGIFYDRQGRDWDATIIKIVDNPISIRQAFWSPYKRLARYIEDMIAKRAAAADTAAQGDLTGTVTRVETAVAAPAGTAPAVAAPPSAAGAQQRKLDVGVVAALGVAVGAITTAGTLLLSWLGGTPVYMLPVYFVLLILLISMPSMVLAALKLRQRNMGPILDANGWAVNAKAKINIPFGASLTGVAKLPPGSHVDIVDPFAEDKSWRKWFVSAVTIVVVIAAAGWATWYFGGVEKVWPHLIRPSGYMERRAAQEAVDKAAQDKAAADKAAKDAAGSAAASTVPATTAPAK